MQGGRQISRAPHSFARMAGRGKGGKTLQRPGAKTRSVSKRVKRAGEALRASRDALDRAARAIDDAGKRLKTASENLQAAIKAFNLNPDDVSGWVDKPFDAEATMRAHARAQAAATEHARLEREKVQRIEEYRALCEEKRMCPV